MKHARDDYDRIQDPAGLIPADEPVFLIRGQDQVGAAVVAHWAYLNERDGGDPVLTELARGQAKLMRDWPTHKLADARPYTTPAAERFDTPYDPGPYTEGDHPEDMPHTNHNDSKGLD